ncbi:MAG: hypothetical protein L6R38_005210 [Xanthoria sp. 2 TBL-2021]|nr:MAG: hypothetical protein L6R38_005210 [Xanthoria sp. 2 TBL-2021]
MHRDPSLGTFTALSREIRDQIWECLSVQRRFTIFQTSRQIYTEATQAFYNVQILQFHISPEYQYKSWLTLESNFVTDGSPRLLILQDLNHTLQQGFDKLPFEKLKKIQINIGAPDAADPGQAICLHKKCVDLAALLEHAKHGLPDIEINLVDTSSAKWSSDDKPQRSVSIDPTRHFPYYEFDGKGPCRTSLFWTRFHPENKPSRSLELDPWKSETRNNYEDNEIVLYAFCHLRNARSAKVSGPEQPADYCFNRNVARNLEEEEPFGTYPEPGDVWGDQCIQEDRDKLFMHLDLDLDLLPGPTADMMRLDRFSSWYSSTFGGESKYEKEYERIIKT